MAKKLIEELVDDLDGSPAAHTVRIGWDNEWRELELSDKNLTALSKSFDRFWEVARPVTASASSARRRPAKTKPRSRTRKANGSASSYDRNQFRTWAVENDVQLKRGRPPRQLVERFLAAQGAR